MSVRLRRFCSHLTDTQIAKLDKQAKSDRCGNWDSHTARYRGDPAYRADMLSRLPIPYPEWLVYSHGEVARLDGARGTQFP